MRILLLLLFLCSPLMTEPQAPQQPPRGFGGPIELGVDDKQVFDDPPRRSPTGEMGSSMANWR